jgi:hypothetical protein
MAKTSKINLTDLQVNTDNYRFEPVGSQKEAIDKMIHNQREKLFNLAEHIVTNGLNPNDNIQVVRSTHDIKKFNVVEGNRRLVALKILNHPDLLDGSGHASLKKKFVKLHEQIKGNLPKVIECTVYDNPKDADVWIGVKHGYGKNGSLTDGWDPFQKGRFEEKIGGKSSTVLQTLKLLADSPDVPLDIKSRLETLKVTNLDRLISDPAVRTFLGMEIKHGMVQSSVAKGEVVKGLAHMAKDLLDPKFNVKKIYTKEDRQKYLSSFPKTSQPNTKLKAKGPWEFVGVHSGSSTKPSSKHKANPIERKYLIPKSCVLLINKPKVNSIYHELMKLDVHKFNNATSVLFRVFVELSIDCYIEANGLTSSASAAKSGMNFQQKVFLVANHLENKKLVDAAVCKGVKFSIKENHNILGLDTWHAYVHNNSFSASPKNLLLTWDGMQDFMVILWNNIK